MVVARRKIGNDDRGRGGDVISAGRDGGRCIGVSGRKPRVAGLKSRIGHQVGRIGIVGRSGKGVGHRPRYRCRGSQRSRIAQSRGRTPQHVQVIAGNGTQQSGLLPNIAHKPVRSRIYGDGTLCQTTGNRKKDDKTCTQKGIKGLGHSSGSFSSWFGG